MNNRTCPQVPGMVPNLVQYICWLMFWMGRRFSDKLYSFDEQAV